jgi:IclR family pca regulon transcriptional regulator
VTVPGNGAPESGDFVQSLARGLSVITAFDADHPSLTVSDVARRADLTRAAARRFLHTLQTLGYVRSDGRSFSLTPRVLELGTSYLSGLTVPQVAQPHLERLSREVDESVSAAVLDGQDIAYVARAPGRRIMSVTITVGTRFPAYATAMGRVLLAALAPAEAERRLTAQPLAALTDRTQTDPEQLMRILADVRNQGWALVDGELERGLQSVAVPVHGPDGVVAAINISTASTLDSAVLVESTFLPALTATAEAIAADLRTAQH